MPRRCPAVTWAGAHREGAALAGAAAGRVGAAAEDDALPTEVAFSARGQGEQWARRFDRWPMVSRLWAHEGLLREQLGAVRFEFALQAARVASTGRCGGSGRSLLPLPTRWFGGVRCREAWRGERYTFRVDVRLPWVGALIRYEGWLEPQ